VKWVIKNPAPSDSRRKKWGDFHFGRSLTTHLERRGHQVVSHYDPGWDTDEPADVVLVLRGKYPFPPGSAHAGALRVMWNISHPADVTLEEYATYDLVCVASRWWASELAAQLDVPVVALLQCTDPEEFHPDAGTGRAAQDVVFVGNTRDEFRPGVMWALEYGLPVKIWGRGWASFGVPDDQVVADYIANERLGALYATSRATINDHWDDMKRFGYVNNRLLDALACGLPVVSDWHPAAQELLPRGVLWYRDQLEFEQCMQSLLLDHPHLKTEAEAAGEQVRAAHTFEQRASELCRQVEGLRT
jgi:glycosyltransferase involved in cell wall biosynthesis